MIQLIDADTIIDLVVDYYGVSRDLLFSELRYKDLVIPRHVCRYLMHKNTSLPLRQIAAEMKGRKNKKNDHSTIISSCKVIMDLMETDPNVKLQVAELQNFIDMHKEKEFEKIDKKIKSRREKFLEQQRQKQMVYLEKLPPAPIVRRATESEHEKLINKYL
jgi:hypothetical protein